MSDDPKVLDQAMEAVRKAWEAEKVMLDACLRAGYMQDGEQLRAAVQKRINFYGIALRDLQQRLDVVKATHKDAQGPVDKVALRLLESVFGEGGIDK